MFFNTTFGPRLFPKEVRRPRILGLVVCGPTATEVVSRIGCEGLVESVSSVVFAVELLA